MKKRFFIAAVLAALAVQTSVIPAAVTVSAESTVQAVQSAAKTTAVLSADKISLGASVTVKAAPEAAEGCEYAFYCRMQGGGTWTTAKKYSKDAFAVIKPSKAGKYDICAKTKNSSGKITKEYLSISVVDDLAVNGSLSVNKAAVGTGVKVSAKANGGSGGYKYEVYWKKKTASSWKTSLKDSASCSVLITPVNAGEYDVCVKVKDRNGILKKEYFTFEAFDFKTIVSFSHDEITLGQSQTINAYVSGTGEECMFAFYYRKTGADSWKQIQWYGTKNTVNILPKEAGTYEVCAKAKNPSGIIRKTYSEFTVNKELTVKQKFSAVEVKVGDTLTVTPSSSGGTGKVQYAVYYALKSDYESGANKWKTALAFGQSGNAVISVTQPGEYVVVTKAKDEAGCIKKTGYEPFTVTKKSDAEKLTVKGTFSGGQSTVYSDTPAIFTANASGGAGGYTYSLKYREKGTTEWKLLRSFGTDPKFILKKSAFGSYTLKTSNNFELTVSVKDADGKTASAVYSFTVTSSDHYELPVI